MERVLKNLSGEQKRLREKKFAQTFQLLKKPDLLKKKTVTADQTWVFQYDPETKFQSLQW
jgi:hypothetical protein